MNNKQNESVFYLTWEDNLKNQYRVGFLAQIHGDYYLVIKRQQEAESAYEKGFIGIPRF